MKNEVSAEQHLSQQIQEYIALLQRGWSTILLVALAISLVSILVITYLPDEYRATTTILVDPQKIPERYVTSTITSDPNERLNTITQQVLSETKLAEIIERMRLYPELKGYSREELVENMRRHISLQVKQGSGQGLSSFTITYSGRSPVEVAAVANDLAGSFIEWNLKNRQQLAASTTQFLSTQLEEAKENLQRQEQKLRDFKMQHLGEMPDQMQANLQALSRLQVSLQANSDALNRNEQERQLLIRIPEPISKESPVQLGERERLEVEKKQLEYQIWELRKKYTDSHPDILHAQRRLQQVSAQLQSLPPLDSQTASSETSSTAVRLELLNREKQHVLDEQRKIKAQFEMYQAKVDAVPVREQQLTELTRDYEISKEHYRSLLEKTFSAEMATELERRQEGEHFTIIDPARRPERPFKPNRLLLMFSAFLASVVCGVVWVFLRDKLSSAVKSEAELAAILPSSVPMLGSLPWISTMQDRRRKFLRAACAVGFSLLACSAVALVVWKVKPIL